MNKKTWLGILDSCSGNRRSFVRLRTESKIQNRKWLGLSVIAFVLVVTGALAQAQQQARLPQLGLLGVRPAASDTGRELFKREFRARGYVEGKNVFFEYRSADDKLERLPALADELVRLKVDVLLASATPAAVAAKNATRTIPIVFLWRF
jgi:putative ABC transport system substrate-binding protein